MECYSYSNATTFRQTTSKESIFRGFFRTRKFLHSFHPVSDELSTPSAKTSPPGSVHYFRIVGTFSRPLFERIAGDETVYNSILSNPLTLPAPRSAPIVATDVLSQHGRASIISKLARLFFLSFAHIFANIFDNELRIMS